MNAITINSHPWGSSHAHELLWDDEFVQECIAYLGMDEDSFDELPHKDQQQHLFEYYDLLTTF